MKSQMLSARDRRALIMAASVIPAVLLARGAPAALHWEHDVRRHAFEASAAVARAHARIVMWHELLDSMHARETRSVSRAATLVPGRDPGSAEATLAGIIAKAAASAGLRVSAARPITLPSADSTIPFRKVAVRADVTGDISGLMEFFAALEGNEKDLAILFFAITQSDPAGAPDRMETLNVTLTVAGLARVRGRSR